MADPSSTPTTARAQLQNALLGATLGALAALGAMALGIPPLVGLHGHALVPVVAVIGALVSLTRARVAIAALTAALSVIVGVVAFTPLVDAPFATLVRTDPPPSAPLGAVFVLSGAVSGDSLLGPEALDRLLYGAELVKGGTAPVLVITGATEGNRRGSAVTAARDQQRIVTLTELDPAQVLTIDSVWSTHDEAVRGWAVLAPRGIRRIALVTSPAHTRRACRTFERAGFSVTCRPAPSRAYPASGRDRQSARARLQAFRYWLYERVGLGVYHLRGWI